ncbi:MAG: PDZ domain-containing protein [Calditrichaceae bacterium]
MYSFKMVTVFLLITLTVLFSSAADGKKEIKIRLNVEGKYGLGMLVRNLDENDQEKLNRDSGALVVDVIDESEAQKIGVQKNDVIVSFEGAEIKSADELHDLVKDYDDDKSVTFKSVRDGREMSFAGTFTKLNLHDYEYNFDSDDFDFDMDMEEIQKIPGMMKEFHVQGLPHITSDKGGFLGVQAKNLKKQMLDYFKAEYGVLVEEVIKDSPAEKAGLKAGDVITGIEKRKIEDYSDLVRTLNYYNPDEKVNIKFIRNGSKKDVTVTLEKKTGAMNIQVPDQRMIWLEKEELDDSLNVLKDRVKVLKKHVGDVKSELKDLDIDFKIYII